MAVVVTRVVAITPHADVRVRYLLREQSPFEGAVKVVLHEGSVRVVALEVKRPSVEGRVIG